MYWLIEDIKHIETICRIKYQVAYVEVIPTSHNLHPIENDICAIYIRPRDDSKGYIIPINHSETINFDLEVVEKVLNSIEYIYVRDRKEFLHYFALKHCTQTSPSPHTYIPQLTQAHTQIYNRFPNVKNLNTIVPIVKHYEVCEQNFANYEKNRVNPFYNKAALVFNQLERAGIKVDQTKFDQYFDKQSNEFVYTQYNLNTLTTRPSNTFGGINFSTLNKDNGERECFIPRNDFFIEMDISAYHPTLLGNLLGHAFGDSDVHMDFAQMYGVDYKQAKEITFKQLYGGIWKEYRDLPFFQKVQTYVDDLWKQFETHGYIKCPISDHKFIKREMDDMNPQKLLNYVLQNLETANNVLILWDIFKVLRGKNTKLVLYVYDSFLFDFDENEPEVILEIIEIFNKYKLQTKTKKGTNYNNLK
jgi:hypothetical protein